MRPALEQANPWWREVSARPTLPAPLPGELVVRLRPAAVEIVHAAPRTGATTFLLRAVATALDAGRNAAYIPAGLTTTWGTGTLLEGLFDEHRPDVIAIDDPEDDDWPAHLKWLIDSGSGVAAATIVIVVPGIRDAKDIAGTLAGRQGSGGRHLLLPRRFRDLLKFHDPQTFSRVEEAAQNSGDDLIAFARLLQVLAKPMRPRWDAYVLHGSLPPVFGARRSQLLDEESALAAAREVSARSSRARAYCADALEQVRMDPAVTLAGLSAHIGRSHSWVRRLDRQAEESLVWFKVPQSEKRQGATRRMLVDPAYAATPEMTRLTPRRGVDSLAALLRSVWQVSVRNDVDRVVRHGLEWRRQGDHELFVAGQWAFEVLPNAEDRRRLRPLRTMASRGFRPVRVTSGAVDLTDDPPAIPAWTLTLAFEFGVLSTG